MFGDRDRDPLVVVAVDVQDPGNLGALVRVAEAAGATGVVIAGASADPFGWKALRGSMGSALRLPSRRRVDIGGTLSDCGRGGSGCRIVAAVAARRPSALRRRSRRDRWRSSSAAKAPACRPTVLDQADVRVTIPMEAPVESLNAAVTAALLVYEARRQRVSV